MGKVREIGVSVAYLKALPNYENVRITAEAKVTVEDGESVDDVYAKTWDAVGRQVGEQLKLFSDKSGSVKKGL